MRDSWCHIGAVVLDTPRLGPEQFKRVIVRDRVVSVEPDAMNLTLGRRREVELEDCSGVDHRGQSDLFPRIPKKTQRVAAIKNLKEAIILGPTIRLNGIPREIDRTRRSRCHILDHDELWWIQSFTARHPQGGIGERGQYEVDDSVASDVARYVDVDVCASHYGTGHIENRSGCGGVCEIQC